MSLLIGSRLRKAREETGLSQGAFAKSLGISSEYISLLEAGKRTPSFETLDKIAAFLKKEISFFFEHREPAFTILSRGEDAEGRSRFDVEKFRRYCEHYLSLEEITGRRLETAPLYANLSPERMADEERRRLGLGDEPIRDIFALCELNGCRIYRQNLPEDANMSGLFVFIEDKNAAFVLINGADPWGRQVFTAAHEYAHYLRDRNESPILDNPDVFVDEVVSLYPPRERFAQAFASRFLMPPSKIREIVERDIKPHRIGYDDVLFLKRYFGVGTHAMLRTLRNLGYLRRERFEEYFKREPSTREKEVFGGVRGAEPWSARLKNGGSERYLLLKRHAEKILQAREEGEKEKPEDPQGTLLPGGES